MGERGKTKGKAIDRRRREAVEGRLGGVGGRERRWDRSSEWEGEREGWEKGRGRRN